MPGIGEDEADLIMHGQLEVTKGMTPMGADTLQYGPVPSSQTLPPCVAERRRRHRAARYSGQAVRRGHGGDAVPEAALGQLTDKFGVSRMVNIAGAGADRPASTWRWPAGRYQGRPTLTTRPQSGSGHVPSVG